METVGVVIATFGDFGEWGPLIERAADSVSRQKVHPEELVRYHGLALFEARNSAIAELDTEWVICLDADDELDEGYIDAMLHGTGDVRWPSTLGVVDGREDDFPVLLQPKRNFLHGNHCVIGSMFRRERFLDVGGFRNLDVLEDYDLWLRLRLQGNAFAPCPEAVYRVHVRGASRNGGDPRLHGAVFQQLQREYGVHIHNLNW